MNLPLITSKIGEISEEENVFSSLIKPAKIKKDKEYQNVFMIFNLNEEQIEFEPVKFNENKLEDYKYFGNNPSHGKQFFLTREVGSFNYLIFSVWSNLFNELNEGNFTNILQKIIEKDLLIKNEKNNTLTLNLEKIEYFKKNNIKIEIVEDKKPAFKISEENGKVVEEKNYEKFIKRCLNTDSKENIALIVPAIRENNEEKILLSDDEDYQNYVKRTYNLGDEENQISDEKYCFICEKIRPNSKSGYLYKLSRSSVNKIFTMTTINSAKNIDKKNYDYNYSVCSECYRKLLNGEKNIDKKFRIQIAGEKAYVIPEAYLESFDYGNFEKIKDEIDLAFNPKNFANWSNQVKSEAETIEEDFYSLNFIIYNTDGKFFEIKTTFEDVNNKYLSKLIKLFYNQNKIFENLIRNFGMHNIYHMIPVRKSNDVQVNIKRVLSLYNSILKKEKIKKRILFEYYSEALEKGYHQINSNNIRDYKNLSLRTKEGKIIDVDFFIKRITYSYLALLNVLNILNILDKNIFCRKEVNDLKIEECKEYINNSIEEMERFLNEKMFSNEAKSLFYLGILINIVAAAQYSKGHEKKPILNKISFQGMNIKDILRLYNDILEKLRQYNKYTMFSQSIMKLFHQYFGNTNKAWNLSDKENVFYLMCGYSFVVGKKVENEENKGEEDGGETDE